MRRKVLVLLLTLSLILSFTPMIAFADMEAEGSVPSNETIKAEEPEEPVQGDVETEKAEEPADETLAVEEESAEDASPQTVVGRQSLNALASEPESEECKHNNKNTEAVVDWENATCDEIKGDNSYHTVTYVKEEVTYCDYCGEEQSRRTVGQETDKEEHDYDENHVCRACGHKNECTHEETYTYNNWDEEAKIDYTAIDDRFHMATGLGEKVTECDICGEVLSREKTDQLEEEQEHDYDENHVCRACGHKNECTHEETYTYNYWDEEVEPKYEFIDNRFHKKTGSGEKVTECDICGEELSREESDQLEEEQEHDYDENHECVDCGHTNTCTHKNTSTAEGERNWEEADFEDIGNDKLHKVKCPVEELTVCDDCGEVVGTKTVEDEDNYYHDYDSNGKCTECKHINKCEHKHQRVEYEWNDKDVNPEPIDDTYHKVTGPGNRLTWCADCGVLIKTEKVDNVDTTEEHDYNSNHICEYCDYVNKCKHSNTYTYNNWDSDDVHFEIINDTYHKVTGPGVKVTVCEDCGERFTTEVDNVDDEEYHNYNSAHICINCEHKNECKHPSQYFEYDYSPDRCIIEDLGNGSKHKVTGRIEMHTYCKVCEEELKEEILGYKTVEEIHYYDENDTCRYCGYKMPTECVHEYDDGIVSSEPTCTKAGVKTYTCKKCKEEKTEPIPALGHDYDSNDVCKRCGDKKPSEDEKDDIRIFGKNRIETAKEVAEEYKDSLGKFKNVIVASGMSFPDALAGGYLAKIKNAPILLVDQSQESKIVDYISDNIASGGTVYILGGTGVVSLEFENALKKKNLKNPIRLGGKDRYKTNMYILKAAGVSTEDILVCTGTDFADSLSAAAVGKPILLVGKNLTDEQKNYIQGLKSKQFYLIGGKGAVNSDVEDELKKFVGITTKRIAGKSRYETSTEIAKEFFSGVTTVMLAYAQNFPDGLSGGPLAMLKDAPIVLTDSDKTAAAKAYVKSAGIVNSITLGGPALISDIAVKTIMGR